MKKLVLIGASTGGPSHLKTLLEDIDTNGATIVIAQHMNQIFLPSFASQFDRDCKSSVKLIEEDCFLEDGNIYICRYNTSLDRGYSKIKADIMEGDFPFSPNVDLLFNSSVRLARDYNMMAILMTGIGDDGAKGLFELAKHNVNVIGQDAKSCVVFGMPKRAKELNPNLSMQSLSEIKLSLANFLTKG